MSEVLAKVLTDFGQAVVQGLSQTRKTIPARFLYDLRGSELFEEITRLSEYYPTRCERALLEEHAHDLVRLLGRGRPVVEFGAGSISKTPLLLNAIEAGAFVPIDISGEFLETSMAALAHTHPHLPIVSVAADFTQPLVLPRLEGPLIGFFPGSTVGNFDHRASIDLLRSFRQTLGPDAHLVIGIDTRKNSRLIEAAYDDAAGVTAEFNLNLLHRINRELDGSIPVEAFEHRAVWHDGVGRIEMHLVATRDVTFTVARRQFSVRAGESIHTENSYKYTREEAWLLARGSGWEPLAYWTDADQMFGLHVWAAMPQEPQP